MAITLRKNAVIESWGMIIEGGAGKEKRIMEETYQYLQQANIPDIRLRKDIVSTGMFGRKREYVILGHNVLREYVMFIGAKDFGANLDASWFLTLWTSGFKRAVSARTTGNPYALSRNLDIMTQQDLRAWVTVAHHCFKRSIDVVCEELQQTPPGINNASKGFLSVW